MCAIRLIISMVFFIGLGAATLVAQNTIGLISFDENRAYSGYTMIFPHGQPHVYLINNCGEIVHQWEDEFSFRPGNVAYLLEDGSLIKAKRNSGISGDAIWAGGGGAIVEKVSWSNELIWTFEMNNDSMRLHHDIEVMPNGNVLMIAWELKTMEEAIAAGRNPDLLSQGEMWPDMIVEYDPVSNDIVWEWHAWDHLVQDYDSSKANFGDVTNNAKIDLNYDANDGKADWMHTNSIDYHAELDQILISVPTFNEVWIIDHSTTTAEASTSSGGLTNHGGDILYRVGNPAAYHRGDVSDQTLFYQHDAHWANDFLPNAHPNKNDIVTFNNRQDGFSTVEVFQSEWDMDFTDYNQVGGVFLPFSFGNTINHPDPSKIYSTGLSSAQLLPNGNTLICSGRSGYIVELDTNEEIVWEYVTPLQFGNPAPQYTTLNNNDNLTFRAFKYPEDYQAFDDKDLKPIGFIELLPDEDYCDELTDVSVINTAAFSIYPNPASDMIHVTWNTEGTHKVTIYDILGRIIMSDMINGGIHFLDISELKPDIYFLSADGKAVQKLIKK